MPIYIKLFLSAVFWGGTFVAARVAAQHVGPFSGSFLRFVIASFFLVALLLLTEGRIPVLKRHQVIPAILLGITGVFSYNVFFFLGMKTVDAGRASLIVASNPMVISVLSALFFRERLDIGKILGILLCLGGATAVISFGIAGALAPLLRVGDAIIATHVVAGREHYTCDAAWSQILRGKLSNSRSAIVVGVDQVVSDSLTVGQDDGQKAAIGITVVPKGDD